MIQIEWDIIERKLEQELTPGEEARFKEWYEASRENKEYFDKIVKFYREEGMVKEVTDEDAEASWERFSSRVQRDVRPRKKRGMYYWMLSGAAACVAAFGLMFLLQWQGGGEEHTPIMPENKRAVLTLSNGREVELNSESKEMEDVVARIINSGSGLSYVEKKDTMAAEEIYNQVRTPLGGEYRLTLADGTRVLLGAMSTIKYPVTFTGENRVVEVSGEAYFDVVKDTEHPFIVELENMKVEVLGTSFNVRDYEDEAFAEATLVSGKVKVVAGDELCVLEPSYQAVIDKSARSLKERKVEVSEYVDWIDGKLNIRNQRLEDILTRLGKWYNIHVFYTDEKSKDIRFYASVDRYDDLNKLLEIFEKTDLVKFEVKGNVVRASSVK